MPEDNTKYIDYLNEDEPVPGQLWVCISFLSPEGIKNCSVRGLKIRGVFGTKQEADKRADELRKGDPDFHVFVGEMGKWLPWDPDPNDVKEQIYQEKELNDLMKGYKENLEKSKRMQQQRKEDMIRQAAIEEKSREEKTKKRLQKKLEAKKNQQKINVLANRDDGPVEKGQPIIDEESDEEEEDKTEKKKEKELKLVENKLKEQEKLSKDERLRLTSNQKQIDEKTQNLETIENKLSRMQELWDKINKK
jgi:hypothetical protein